MLLADRVYILDHCREELSERGNPLNRLTYLELVSIGDRQCRLFVDPKNGKLHSRKNAKVPEDAVKVHFPQNVLYLNGVDHRSAIDRFNENAQRANVPCSIGNEQFRSRVMENILPQVTFLDQAYQVDLLKKVLHNIEGGKDVRLPDPVLYATAEKMLYFHKGRQCFMDLLQMEDKHAEKCELVYMPPASQLDPVGFNRIHHRNDGHGLLHHYYHAAEELRTAPVNMIEFRTAQILLQLNPETKAQTGNDTRLNRTRAGGTHL